MPPHRPGQKALRQEDHADALALHHAALPPRQARSRLARNVVSAQQYHHGLVRRISSTCTARRGAVVVSPIARYRYLDALPRRRRYAESDQDCHRRNPVTYARSSPSGNDLEPVMNAAWHQ